MLWVLKRTISMGQFFEHPQHLFTPFHSGNWYGGTLSNSENPDEMTHKAAFHQINIIFRDRNASFYRNFDWHPLKIQNGQFHTYCINMYGIIHQNEKVKLIDKKTTAILCQKIWSFESGKFGQPF